MSSKNNEFNESGLTIKKYCEKLEELLPDELKKELEKNGLKFDDIRSYNQIVNINNFLYDKFRDSLSAPEHKEIFDLVFWMKRRISGDKERLQKEIDESRTLKDKYIEMICTQIKYATQIVALEYILSDEGFRAELDEISKIPRREELCSGFESIKTSPRVLVTEKSIIEEMSAYAKSCAIKLKKDKDKNKKRNNVIPFERSNYLTSLFSQDKDSFMRELRDVLEEMDDVKIYELAKNVELYMSELIKRFKTQGETRILFEELLRMSQKVTKCYGNSQSNIGKKKGKKK